MELLLKFKNSNQLIDPTICIKMTTKLFELLEIIEKVTMINLVKHYVKYPIKYI